jgi:hypothetical protein
MDVLAADAEFSDEIGSMLGLGQEREKAVRCGARLDLATARAAAARLGVRHNRD